MKFLIIAISFFVCVLVGAKISSKYNKRKQFFVSLIALADKLSLEINFSRERLKVLLENFDTNTKKHLLGIDEKFIEFLDKKIELSSETLLKNVSILKPEEKDLIVLFFKTLGRSDVENQTKEIQNFVSRFNEIKSSCDIEQKKYGSLALKLGVVAGLFISIILL